nr:MAG TPA: virion morphogenesis protein [Caudoviricetes sp.]
MGREVRKYSRKNIRRQQSVDGVPFPPRRDKRDKRKLLQSIGKRLEVIGGPDSGVLVSWKEALWGTAAYRNQHGVGKDWTPAGIRRQRGTPDYNAPATRKQAKLLVRNGYRAGGKKAFHRVTVRWIETHMTLGGAGLALRILLTGKARGKQRWNDAPPAREFLGVTQAQTDEIINKVAQDCLNRIAQKGKL